MAQAETTQKNNMGKQEEEQPISSFPSDLLQRLMSENYFYQMKLHQETEGDEEAEDDIELTLGLSLNGRFGVDPRANKLTRSSSIPDFINPTTTRENGSPFLVPTLSSSTNLVRTCSLPVKTEEEWRKRKEIQTLRRMEAKRKRSEKQRILKNLRDRKEESCEEGNCFPPALVAVPLSQGSIESQGSGSSGISESESQPVQGMNRHTDARSPSRIWSVSECDKKLTVTAELILPEKSASPAGVVAKNNKIDRCSVIVDGAKEMMRNVLEDMPCVFTKGDGPNGKRIEGFLYRYRKGEQVRIVCVCHGSFLSPAEFVKHAGGGDVAHPLKHIVVNPSPLFE